MDIISQIDKIYKNKCENITLENLKHPLLEEEIGKEHIGNAASKHLVQNSSLLGHLQKLGTFEVSLIFRKKLKVTYMYFKLKTFHKCLMTS